MMILIAVCGEWKLLLLLRTMMDLLNQQLIVRIYFWNIISFINEQYNEDTLTKLIVGESILRCLFFHTFNQWNALLNCVIKLCLSNIEARFAFNYGLFFCCFIKMANKCFHQQGVRFIWLQEKLIITLLLISIFNSQVKVKKGQHLCKKEKVKQFTFLMIS